MDSRISWRSIRRPSLCCRNGHSRSGLVAAHDLAHRPARHRQSAHNLLDRALLLKIGAAYLADQVHANHPRMSFQADQGQRKDADTSRQKGGIIGRENHPTGGHYCKRFYNLDKASALSSIPQAFLPSRLPPAFCRQECGLPLTFHPVAIRASAVVCVCGKTSDNQNTPAIRLHPLSSHLGSTLRLLSKQPFDQM